MEANFADELFNIIKRDDLKAFNSRMEKTSCVSYRYGRFPVLSVMYLFGCKKLIKAYEKQLLNAQAVKNLHENAEIFFAFNKRAGKCLRYYDGETVTPAEMLLILDRTVRLKKLYPALTLSEAQKKRMQGVYFTRYSLSIKFTDKSIIFDRRPLNAAQKKNILLLCAAGVLCAGAAAALPFIVNRYSPFIADESGAYSVYTLSGIDFASDNVYKLKSNIKLPENFYSPVINCTLVGEGHTLTLKGEKTPFGMLNGTISDISVNSDGKCALFATVGTYALADGIELNVVADSQFTVSGAFFAEDNFGTIRNVTANISGSVSFLHGSGQEAVNFGCIVNNNGYSTSLLGKKYGEIIGCTANFNNLELTGEVSADACFAGICAVNGGTVSACSTYGTLSSDTVDAGGICVTNNYVISDSNNAAKISARSQSAEWNLRTAGIAVVNSGNISGANNFGEISAISLISPKSYAAGICAVDYGTVESCMNGGNVSAVSDGTSYAGGISSVSVIGINYCVSEADVLAEGNKAYAGGILGYSDIITQYSHAYFCIVKNSVAEGEVKAKGAQAAYAGGILGFAKEKIFYNDEKEIYYGGGANACAYIGSALSEGGTIGAAGGICGGADADIYIKNAYTGNGGIIYENFKDNYFSYGGNAVGATVSYGEDGNEVSGEGGNTGATHDGAESIKAGDLYKSVKERFGK